MYIYIGFGKIPWRRAWQPTPVFCLENPVDRRAWWAVVHRVAKSQTWLSMCVCGHARTHTHINIYSFWSIFSTMVYHRILSIVRYRNLLFMHSINIYASLHLLIPNSPSIPPPPPSSLVTMSLFSEDLKILYGGFAGALIDFPSHENTCEPDHPEKLKERLKSWRYKPFLLANEETEAQS